MAGLRNADARLPDEPFASYYMVDLAKARRAAVRARLDSSDPVAAVAWFVALSLRRYRKTTEETAADLCMSEADVYNARTRPGYQRRAA
jgi:hypothetical protein